MPSVGRPSRSPTTRTSCWPTGTGCGLSRRGAIPSRVQFSAKKNTVVDFEGLSLFDFLVGSGSTSNARSWAVHELNTTTPIAGKAEARARFELRNEDMGGGNQQGGLRVRIEPMQSNWADVKSVKLKIRADSSREVRVNLTGGGVRMGWTVMASDKAAESTLALDALSALPGAMADKDKLLMKVENIEVVAWPKSRGADGRIEMGTSDAGFVAIDDLLIEAK